MTTVFQTLLPPLAEAVAAEFRGREDGHCVRVDSLSYEDSVALCQLLRDSGQESFVSFVLNPAPAQAFELRPDHAVEKRNPPNPSFCLIVPRDFSAEVPKSLENAFSVFDLRNFLASTEDHLVASLPEEIRTVIRRLKARLKGRAAVSAEDRIAYYLDLREKPVLSDAGRSLWRLGLIPDFREDFLARIEQNRRSVDAISRPSRPQNSAAERIAELGLPSGDFNRRLIRFLSSRVLHDTEAWQRPIAEDPAFENLSFDHWPFPEHQFFDLQSIQVEPFADSHGEVASYCHLEHSAGVGTALVANVGPKKKVALKWVSDPINPKGVTHWCVELIPARSQYGDTGSTLLVEKVKATLKQIKTARIKLDLDLEEIEYRAVEFRVSALGSDGQAVCDVAGEVISGHSDEFWLTKEEDEEGVDRLRKLTDISLPLARLRASYTLPHNEPELPESNPLWQEEDTSFSIQLRRKILMRLATSQVLCKIQDYILENPKSGWLWADIDSEKRLSFPDIQWDALPDSLVEQKPWADFLKQRDQLCRELRGREARRRVESLDWDNVLTDRVRKYARSYRDLLESTISSSDLEALRWVLTLDALQIRILYPGGGDSTAALILPLHPLRLLWYGAYAELLEHWRTALVGLPKSERRDALDFSIAERLVPAHMPLFVPGQGDQVHVFAQNLGIFLGVAFPADVPEPGRLLMQISDLLGLPSELVSFSDFPQEKLTRNLLEYQHLHDYVSSFRISVSNAGDGLPVIDGLREMYARLTNEWESRGGMPRLDLIAHYRKPLPLNMPEADKLRAWLEAQTATTSASHLAPTMQLAIRSEDLLSTPPGGDVNLVVLFDESRATVALKPTIEGQDSASGYGLITHLVSRFDSQADAASWVHQAAFPSGAAHEKHPVTSGYTADLVDTQRAMLQAEQRRLNLTLSEPEVLSLVVQLDAEHRDRLNRVHKSADWVLLLDRYIGIDLFDDPRDPFLSESAKKYLLDYAPEFVEGLGHKLIVTTAWREEIEEVLRTAMADLGFEAVEESVGQALQHLKSISGRLALRLIHDNTRAKEVAGLGAAVAWMKANGDLADSILIPVDSHPEIFASEPSVPGSQDTPDIAGSMERCDLVQVRVYPRRIDVTFVEVKLRRGTVPGTDLADRMCDQMDATENRFRRLFFSDQKRLDHVFQRSKLHALLRFYAGRAARYGFFSGDGNQVAEKYTETLRLLSRLEGGIPTMRSASRGYIVDLAGSSREPFTHRGAEFRILTASDFEQSTSLRTAISETARRQASTP
jgi:hypothetical protein